MRTILRSSLVALFASVAACAVSSSNDSPRPAPGSDAARTPAIVLTALPPLQPLPPPPPSCSTPSPLAVDEKVSAPLIDPSTCRVTTPKLAYIAFQSLPSDLQSQLQASAKNASIAPTSVYAVYVPAADANGHRAVTLTGDPDCDTSDHCAAGPRSEESCVPQSSSTCEAMIATPHGSIPLGSRIVYPTFNGGLTERVITGTIVVASEIDVSGTVRTNGTDLVLVADVVHFNGVDNVVITTPMRPVVGAGEAAGSVVVEALSIDGMVLFDTSGGPGSYPHSTAITAVGKVGIHPDAKDPSGASYYPCAPSDNTLPSGARNYYWKSSPRECFAPSASDAPVLPITLPQLSGGYYPTGGWPAAMFTPADPNPDDNYIVTLPAAPSGNDGGQPGTVRINGYSQYALMGQRTGTGPATPGLGEYYLDPNIPCSSDPSQSCTLSYPSIYWHVPAGANGQPGSIGTPLIAQGSSLLGYASTASLVQWMGTIAGELVVPDEYFTQAEQSFRKGDSANARALYFLAQTWLGDPTKLPCWLSPRASALKQQIVAQSAKIDNGLGFGGEQKSVAPAAPLGSLASALQSQITYLDSLRANVKLDSILAETQGLTTAEVTTALNNIGSGGVVQAEQAALTLASQEEQARAAEAAAWVTAGNDDLNNLTSSLSSYIASKGGSPNLTSDVSSVATKGAALYAASAALVGGLSLTGVGAAVAAGIALYGALDGLVGDLEAAPFSCDGDATCRALEAQVTAASDKVKAYELGLESAKLAVAEAGAQQGILNAKTTMYQDELASLTASGVTVDPAQIGRAATLACNYGQTLTDRAVASLYALERRAALDDGPSPANDASIYGGAGPLYTIVFNDLATEVASGAQGSIASAYSAFLTSRATVLPPANNVSTLQLGAKNASAQAAMASMFHIAVAPVLLPPTNEIERRPDALFTPPPPPSRIDVVLGLFTTSTGTYLGMKPIASPTAAPVFTAAPIPSNEIDLQTLAWRVTATTGTKALSAPLPFHMSRASVDTYQNDPTSKTPLTFYVQDAPSALRDPLTQWLEWSPAVSPSGATTLFTFPVFDPTTSEATSVAGVYPESLGKGVRLWLSICPSGVTTDPTCATVAEVNALTAISVEVDYRFRATAVGVMN